MLPLAAFTATFLWDGGPPELLPGSDPASGIVADPHRASFTRCQGRQRVTCVVDGDTFWLRGERIRIADINAPETGSPACAREAELGEQATRRITELLNEGGFTLAAETSGRNRDRYGRLLREVTRESESLGLVLVNEGLAEPWKGRRGSWC